MARKKTVRDIDASGKAVLVRVDYNVPYHPARPISPTIAGSEPRWTRLSCLHRKAHGLFCAPTLAGLGARLSMISESRQWPIGSPSC